MKNTIVHHEGAASLKLAVKNVGLSGSVIKTGLDVYARLYVGEMGSELTINTAATFG